MKLPREPFSWDESDEGLVPVEQLDGDRTNVSPPIEGGGSVIQDAPVAATKSGADHAPVAGLGSTGVGMPVGVKSDLQLISATGGSRLRAAALVAACFLAFAHGWVSGAAAHVAQAAGFCDADHCRGDNRTVKWRDGQ